MLNRLIRDGRIIFATRNSPTAYYIGPEGPAGFEYDKAKAFADAYGMTAEFVIKSSAYEVIEAVRSGEAHIGAAGLTKSEKTGEDLYFSAPYLTVKHQLLCRRGGKIPKSVDALAGTDIHVAAGSGYEEVLRDLKTRYPGLEWVSDYGRSVEELIAQVASSQIECTIADSHVIQINRRYYPELVVALDLSEGHALSWVMPQKSTRLHEAYRLWFQRYEASGELARVHDRYYGHYQVFDYVDIRVFHRRVRSRLPQYRSLFEEVAEEYGFSWTLLAAQAYQESHWNPQAKSPTGVRGMMMLTQRTAQSLGFVSRVCPENSIRGGAQYLAKMLSQVSPNVDENERIWFALAAYNIGMGHIHDAQGLAHELGYNPYVWKEFREVLPLLSQKKYYSGLRYGYARGSEPVTYVQRIREFKDILDQQFNIGTELFRPDDLAAGL
jgi:membrane-bound lytic murein transglycosylase F